jgi:hypothetical protein
MDDTFNGLDLLGAEAAKPALSMKRLTVALAAGAIGAVLVPRHPMLGFLNAAAVASNALAVEEGERTWPQAIKRIGRHIVATAGSLALPAHPAIGYVAGAVAADMLIDHEGGGIIQEWADFEGVAPKNDNIIDAEIVSDNTQRNEKALVKK